MSGAEATGARCCLPNLQQDPCEALSFPTSPKLPAAPLCELQPPEHGRARRDPFTAISSSSSTSGSPPSPDSFFSLFILSEMGRGRAPATTSRARKFGLGRRRLPGVPALSAAGSKPDHASLPRSPAPSTEKQNRGKKTSIPWCLLPFLRNSCPKLSQGAPTPGHRGFHRTALPYRKGKAADFGEQKTRLHQPHSSELPACRVANEAR